MDFSKKEMDEESILNHKAQNDENAEQRMAFSFYYNLGKSRSLTKVSEHVGKSRVTTETWSSRFRWQARIKEREKIAAEHSLTLQSIIKEEDLKSKHLQIYDIAISRGVKAIIAGDVKIRTVMELKSLIDSRWGLANMMVPGSESSMSASVTSPSGAKVAIELSGMDREEQLRYIKHTMGGIGKILTKPSLAERAMEKPVSNPSIVKKQPVEESQIIDIESENEDLFIDIDLSV